MAGVKAYAKLGARLVGLNALKSGIQKTSRKTARFLNNVGITAHYLQTGFIILASLVAFWLAWKGWFPSIAYVAFGGHTGEAIQLLSTLDPARYTPRKYIFCTGDIMSLNKATSFEASLKPRSSVPNGAASQTVSPTEGPFHFFELPRARKVGQSYVSSIGTTLYSLAITFWKLAAKPILTRQSHQIPDLLIVNGPGTCVMILGQRSPEIIYVESFARVTSLSLSGKILKNVVDRFIVQWPINDGVVSDAGKVDGEGTGFAAGKGKEALSNVEYHGWLI
ncbi:hypothetical protein QFC22_003592 [Naganishia vaughanmartiniae]|uniref:Uncharacterized protein n=1 Tax=Naganishia vaughanmartiniae TaxID=1424756 RepID=A0ACC2X6P6_9TREE|nr:hypothetical protein QFC22_003592 [Naganishia vaughanmartiniae]